MLERLVASGGQVLVDSTDLRDGSTPGAEGNERAGGEYRGEFQYQVEYEGERGAPFPQLFVDPDTLTRVAGGRGWETDICWMGSDGEYLARLTRKEDGERG
jgi:hypothetical protein